MEDDANSTIDADEADRIKKEKVMWKHLKDEEQRDKLYLNLKEKLEQPLPAPELYEEEKAVEEKKLVDEITIKSSRESRIKIKIQKQHELKYANFWSTNHAAKLSNIRKYDLSEARYKYIEKSP